MNRRHEKVNGLSIKSDTEFAYQNYQESLYHYHQILHIDLIHTSEILNVVSSTTISSLHTPEKANAKTKNITPPKPKMQETTSSISQSCSKDPNSKHPCTTQQQYLAYPQPSQNLSNLHLPLFPSTSPSESFRLSTKHRCPSINKSTRPPRSSHAKTQSLQKSSKAGIR